MKLSICVITMNRAAQLKEALESCLACELPNETEFIVIDNASVDDTEQTVRNVLKDCGFPYYYEKMAENFGVAAVVTKDVPDYSIAAGVPAKVLKSRLSDTSNREENF